MKKWEYLTIQIPHIEFNQNYINTTLNNYGEQGWELVSYFNKVSYPMTAFAIMKREIY